jgi:hypothetical protein
MDDTLSDLLTSRGVGDHQTDATEQTTGYFATLVFSHCCEMLLSTTKLHRPLIGGVLIDFVHRSSFTCLTEVRLH